MEKAPRLPDGGDNVSAAPLWVPASNIMLDTQLVCEC